MDAPNKCHARGIVFHKSGSIFTTVPKNGSTKINTVHGNHKQLPPPMFQFGSRFKNIQQDPRLSVSPGYHSTKHLYILHELTRRYRNSVDFGGLAVYSGVHFQFQCVPVHARRCSRLASFLVPPSLDIWSGYRQYVLGERYARWCPAAGPSLGARGSGRVTTQPDTAQSHTQQKIKHYCMDGYFLDDRSIEHSRIWCGLMPP